jgi:hypothetical protein
MIDGIGQALAVERRRTREASTQAIEKVKRAFRAKLPELENEITLIRAVSTKGK